MKKFLKNYIWICSLLLWIAVDATAETVDSSWCTIKTPDQAVAEGQSFEIEFMLKENAPAGLKTGGDLHFSDEKGAYLGFAAWGGEPRALKPGEKALFRYRLPKLKPGASCVYAQFFLTPTNWEEREKDQRSASIPIALSAQKQPTDTRAVRTKESDWCIIETPLRAEVNGSFQTRVTLKKTAPAGLKIGGDIHLKNADTEAYLGYGSWGGPSKPVAPGESVTFTYRVPQLKGDANAVFIHYYLSPDGWEKREKELTSELILVVDSSATATRTNEKKNFQRPTSATLKKSWIETGRIRRADGKSLDSSPLQEGDEFLLPVRYYVDPSDDWGGTELTVSGVGPWIDCPDGVYSQKRRHKMYPLHIPAISCRTGEVVQETVKIKMPRPFSAQPPENGILGDSLLLILQFRGNDGKSWPWQHRVQLGNFQRKNFYFELDSPQPGHLFPYSSRIEMYVVPGPLAQKSGETRTLHWQVFQPDGKEVASGDLEFSAADGRQLIPISLPAGKRGTFRLRAAVDGWETRETTFATIPDLNAITQGKPTPFGGQKFAENREAVAAVRLLGMSFCRTWVKWSDVQPAPNHWNEEYLSELSESIDHMNETGIIPWILLYDPPAWAIDHPEGWSVDYTPFPFRDEQLVAVVHRLADMFRGKISGFEWLNEICPGKLCSDPVEEYIRFCRVATNTAKSVDPTFEIQAAGGLWPTSYRKSLLAGGLADHIDILPIHYGDSNSVEMARGDLKNYGVDLPIIDNETSLGLATWGMPLTTAIKDQTQSDYFFTRFPAELLAGCRKITVFGGEPDPAGNWTMFWGDMSPRPSAAALAVLISKLWNAKPVGEFSLGKGDSIKLFETPEKRAVMVVSSSARNGEKITLPAGSGELIVTDQQGNERTLKEAETHDLLLTASPYFVEGGNLDVLKAQLIVQPAAGNSSPGQRNYVLGHLAELPVTIANITGKKLNCKMELVQAPGEAAPIEIFELEPGKTIRKSFQFIPEKSGSFDCSIRVTFQTPGFPVVDKRCRLNVIQPESVGNLLKNPGFESGAEKSGMLPAYWRPSPGNAGSRFRFKLQNELGHGDWVFRFQGQEKHYISLFQTLNGPFLPGKYLYSCWIKSDSLQTGSNYSATAPGNKSINKHWLEFFQAPVTQPEWDIFSAIVEVPENAENVTCSPVCFGTGWSMIDNVLLTLYEGTEYVAFAPRGNKIVIDGKLDDFDRSAPIPLLGKSLLRTMSSSYEWSPETFSAVAYFNWDEQNLFLGIEVIDQEHNEGSVEAGCVTGDSVEVALHPQNRLPGEDDKAFLFQISSVVPGGSGKHTIFRPEQHSGGLKAGSLAKDSSIYDIVVRREGQKTCYEISMPWNDLGKIRGEFGTKLGLSLMLNDGNGTRKLASMVWGGGLFPVWNPASFGMLILTEAMP